MILLKMLVMNLFCPRWGNKTKKTYFFLFMFSLSEASKWLTIGDQLLAKVGLNKYKKKPERCYPCPSAGKNSAKAHRKIFYHMLQSL